MKLSFMVYHAYKTATITKIRQNETKLETALPKDRLEIMRTLEKSNKDLESLNAMEYQEVKK